MAGHEGRGPLCSRSNYAGSPAPEDVAFKLPGDGPRPGEGRIARGSRLAGEAFAIVRADRGLLSLMLAAVVVDALIAGAFLGLAAVLVGAHHRKVALFVAFALASFPISVLGTFVNAALMSTLTRRWAGDEASVVDGLGLARERWRTILAWSLIVATVGTILSTVERIGHFAWLGTVAIGGATGLLLLPGVMLGLAGYQQFSRDHAAGVILLALAIVTVVPVIAYSNATSAVFTLAVYRYAEQSQAFGPFAEADLANPFVGAGKRPLRLSRWLARLGRSS